MEIASIIAEPTFTAEDVALILKFHTEVEWRVKNGGVHTDLNIFWIAGAIGLDLSLLQKEGQLMYALWVTLLVVLRKYYKPEELKYPTLNAFREAYKFPSLLYESDEEYHRLWQTANWMAVLFSLITARKNKGLAMQVVPKLVEGWNVKYVTGSGQTRLTANRVLVFETEGGIKANHRGKVKPKKKNAPRRAPYPAKYKVKSQSEIAKLPPLDTGISSRKRKRASSLGSHNQAQGVHDGHTDNDNDDDDDSTINDEGMVNEDIHETFTLWRQQSTNSCFGQDMGFEELGTVPAPSALHRDVTWTEIPVSLLHHSQSQTFSQLAASALGPCPMQRNVTNHLSSPLLSHSESQVSEPVMLLSDSQLSLDMNPPPAPASSVLGPRALKDIFTGYGGLEGEQADEALSSMSQLC
jgi:hypothetical protein